MWQTLAPASTAPDLVADATSRLFPSSPALFILISGVAGLLVLLLTIRNTWRLREQDRRQQVDLVTLRARERRLRLTVQESEDGLVHLEPVRNAAGAVIDFTVSEANARAASLFRRAADQVEGFRASALASLAPDTALFRSLVATVDHGGVFRSEVRAHPRHVATSWLWVRAVAVDGGLSVTLTDIRDRKREAAQLRRASYTDELTGLVNRRAFLRMADTRLREARTAGHDAVLFYIDCDRFKQINDVHGHQAGDRALREISRALRSAVRDTDVVARMGGDEFTILATDAIGACADTIRNRICERIDLINLERLLPSQVAVSIGHVYVPSTSETPLEDLLEQADRDLLLNKRSRRAAHEAMQSIGRSTATPRARGTGSGTGKRRGMAGELTPVVTAA